MINVITPNPAFDVTYEVDQITPGEVHRVRRRHERAGGKGLNVASVVLQRGGRASVTGFLGRDGGARFTALASRQLPGLDQRWVEAPGRVRTCVAVVGDDGAATVLNEPGDPVGSAAWAALVGDVARLAPTDVVAVCGSLPHDSRGADLANLVAAATARGCRVVLDTSHRALLDALPARPTLVKPNREELLELTGASDVVAGARVLLDAGAQAVACSLGAEGAVLVTRDGEWHARPARFVPGNPTGAGDASVAAWCLALERGTPLPEALPDAVACGAAACATPTAGAIDLDVFHELTRSQEENHAHH